MLTKHHLMAGGIKSREGVHKQKPPKDQNRDKIGGVSRVRPHVELSHQATSNSGSDPTKVLR